MKQREMHKDIEMDLCEKNTNNILKKDNWRGLKGCVFGNMQK